MNLIQSHLVRSAQVALISREHLLYHLACFDISFDRNRLGLPRLFGVWYYLAKPGTVGIRLIFFSFIT